VRLDALTIAGLTGTPHHHCGGFFGEAGAPPGAPTRGSDATLSSIQDSSCGSSEREGSVVSILSDELGSVVFSDHDDVEDSCDGGSEVGKGDGGFSEAFLVPEGEKEESVEAGGETQVLVGAEESRQENAAYTAAAVAADRRVSAASSASLNKGGASALSSAPRGDVGDRPFPRQAAGPFGGDEEHEQQQRTTRLPLEHRHHRGGSPPRRDGRIASPTTPRERRKQRPYERNSDGKHPRMRRGSAATANAADSAAVSGADSGGGGVSSSLQTVTPPGPVPTVTCKILVVGNAKCGKSSIISRFVSNRFSSDYNSTVGADYAMKDVALAGGRQVRLQLWDIAGQDRFAKLTRAYFRRAKGAVVVCDVTREGTFDAIVRWKEEIDLWCQNEGCDLPVFLLANKSDLLTEVQDSFLAGARMEKTCRESGFAGWYITSAKRGDNIDTAMTNLLQRALEAEERRNRGTDGEKSLGVGKGGGVGASAGAGGAFRLSSQGRRPDGEGARSACC
ncbi:unnamed protein product, partial [Scytosiphon promiscuus]